MRRALFVSLVFCLGALPARAQTRVYVSGDFFAEVTKFSRLTVTPNDSGVVDTVPGDGVTAGGGVRIGAFFSPEWSLELGVDIGRTLSDVRTVSLRGLGLPVELPVQQYQSQTSVRLGATAVLIGYHPPARGRIHPGFRGGVGIIRRDATYTTASVSTSTVFPTPTPGSPVLVPRTTLTVTTNQYTSLSYGVTATLAAEAAIETSDRFAVVPELRMLTGGIGAIVLRPGIAARWRW
jgi:outer membrane protein with beta-barrel domain